MAASLTLEGSEQSLGMLSDQPGSGTQGRTGELARSVSELLGFPEHTLSTSLSQRATVAVFAEASEPLIPNYNYLREG